MKEKNSIHGVIFDLDGTLIDSYQAIYLAFRFVYEKMGRAPLTFEQVRRAVGQGLHLTFARLLGEEHAPEALETFRQKYEEVYRPHTFLLPGAREVLEGLHARQVLLAVATNKLGRFSREILRHYGMDSLFTAILGDGDVSHPKPQPGLLLRAIQEMGRAREEVIMVGDSWIDIQAGKRAGVRTFAVPTGVQPRAELEEAGPTVVLDRLVGLLDYF